MDLRGRDTIEGPRDNAARRMGIGGRQPTDDSEETNEEHENKSPAPGQGAQCRKRALQPCSHEGNPLNRSNSHNNGCCLIELH